MSIRKTTVELKPYFKNNVTGEIYRYDENDEKQNDLIEDTLKAFLGNDIQTDHGDRKFIVLLDENLNINNSFVRNITADASNIFSSNPNINPGSTFLRFQNISVEHYAAGGKRKNNKRRRTQKKKSRKNKKNKSFRKKN